MSKRQSSDHHAKPAQRPRLATRGTPDTVPSTSQSQGRVRTLRICAIPLSVTENEFRIYLKDLLGYEGFILSFVCSESYTVATVSLTEGEPAALLRCTPGNKIYLPYRETVVGLVVDCDFLGMTPLYSAEEPIVE